jgi:phosphate uptake regulator
MFREIFRALRARDKLGQMFDLVGEMLDSGKWMLERATEVLMRKVEWESVSDDLYTRDRQINETERTVRERIVAHLSVGDTGDLGACLVLMSVVKDAERIGDYCKNIFEVGRFYRHEYRRTEFSKPLDEVRDAVLPLFDEARDGFVEGDRQKARHVLDVARGLTKECDLLVRQLLSVHEQVAPDEAVAYVLLARFYKRVAAHLGNICTSVVSAVPMIDYREA